MFYSAGIAALHAAHPEVFIVAGEIDTGLNQMVGQFVTCSIIILFVKKFSFSQSCFSSPFSRLFPDFSIMHLIITLLTSITLIISYT
jgi:hypothetical protein